MNQRRHQFIFLIVSILLHLSFLGGVQYWVPSQNLQERIDMELVASPSKSHRVGDRGDVSKKVSTHNKKPSFKWTPSQEDIFKEQIQNNRDFSNTQNDFKEMDPQNLWGSYAGLAAKEVRHLQNLWKKINDRIEENQFLEEYNKTGTIVVHFELSKGMLVSGSMRACGEDGVLKVLAARAIRSSFEKLNSSELGDVPESQTLKAEFSWIPKGLCKEGQAAQNLKFCRNVVNKRKEFTKGEKVLEYTKALNYGFDAIDEIRKYHQQEMRRDTRFDPFEKYYKDRDWNLGC